MTALSESVSASEATVAVTVCGLLKLPLLNVRAPDSVRLVLVVDGVTVTGPPGSVLSHTW